VVQSYKDMQIDSAVNFYLPHIERISPLVDQVQAKRLTSLPMPLTICSLWTTLSQG